MDLIYVYNNNQGVFHITDQIPPTNISRVFTVRSEREIDALQINVKNLKTRIELPQEPPSAPL